MIKIRSSVAQPAELAPQAIARGMHATAAAHCPLGATSAAAGAARARLAGVAARTLQALVILHEAPLIDDADLASRRHVHTCKASERARRSAARARKRACLNRRAA